MIGAVNHIAIAVPDLKTASDEWAVRLGVEVTAPQRLDEHGVSVVFISAGNTKIELLEPIDENSPIAGFLEKNPNGGMHHICFDVEDIFVARDRLVTEGARILGDGEPKTGAHGKPVLFAHPKDFTGTLIEIQQA